MSGRQLVEYIVLDIEVVESRVPTAYNHNGRWSLADCTVARLSDFGSNDRTYVARSHLGHLLHPGDHAMGYDVGNANLVGDEVEAAMHKGWSLPEVVLVRKSFEEKRRRRRAKGQQRAWKLRRMAVEYAADEEAQQGGHMHAAQRGRGQPAHELEAADMERFLEELEEDPDMRARVALYRDPTTANEVRKMAARGAVIHPPVAGESDEDDEDGLEVPLEELLDDLAAMQIEEDESHEAGGVPTHGNAMDE
jgi:nonsense-mediated mRNA decay protein 3